MKDRFLTALQIVLGIEGGYSDDPDDKGGRTYLGITEETFIQAKIAGLVSKDKDLTDLTRADVVKIYKKFYWEPAKCYMFPSPLDVVLFDFAVNHGVGGAVRLLQRTMNSFDIYPLLAVDGSFGPKTTAKAKELLALDKTLSEIMPQLPPGFIVKTIVRTMLLERTKKFKDIVEHDVSQKKFFWGWVRQRVVNLGVKLNLL